MKTIAETTGDFMLVDTLNGGGTLWDDRPSVIGWNQFFEARTGSGQVKILATDLPDEANDEDFLAFLKEAGGNVELAVAAYVSTFDAEPTDEREQLETRAKELGVSFNSRTKNDVLVARIAEAEAKLPAAEE